MSVESRMDEFEKVSDKKNTHDVSGRMEEFEQVDKRNKYIDKDKTGVLPYGIKRLKSCPVCGEFMEIQEIKEKDALYYCKGCQKVVTFSVEK
ncbi:MAG: hypothetical protein E7231_17075 [Cellulosilyticum sp.]|nr:hypothetical protein [Cellulosilyticum sp.]